jgi:hypothetical protein
MPWYSCPTTALVTASGEIYYFTTDHISPISTLYVIRYNPAVTRTPVCWEVLYTATAEEELFGDYIDYRWMEPMSAQATQGTLVVFGGTQRIDLAPDYPAGTYVLVLDDGEVVSETLIGVVVAGRVPLIPFYYSHWITIDSTGVIHVLTIEYLSGTSYLYDRRSTDGGLTFVPVLIGTKAGFAYKMYICVDPADNVYVYYKETIYRSTDRGATWASWGVAVSAPVYSTTDFKYLNDALFVVEPGTRSIYRSTDGTNWTEVLNFYHIYQSGASLAYDGTYYYCIFNFRDGLGRTTGHSHVYRSDDGVSWSEVGTFTDDTAVSPSTDQGSSDFTAIDGKLLFTFYYASTLLAGYSDVYMMSVWESTDRGVTWTPIQTPFYDMTTGVAPH